MSDWLIGAAIGLGLLWVGAMYMLITACIQQGKIEGKR